MHLDFIRGAELKREQSTLSATLYNHIHLQFTKNQDETLFVPIRTMAYLAIIDKEEVIFIDSQCPRIVELSWCNFHPGSRYDLHDPIEFTCIYYVAKDLDFMYRIHSEFLQALKLMAARMPRGEATVSKITKNN